MRVLIVGCGYVGLPLGTELARQGHSVFGMRRSPAAAPELLRAGIEPICGDLTDPLALERLPTPFDWVVNTAAASGGGIDDYRRVYLNGTQNLLRRLQSARPQKYLYTSSTGVYGQNDGSVVDESSPTEPGGETAQILIETEQLLLAAARHERFPAVILRVAGIYGPGRGHYFAQYLRREARIEGSGQRILNMIHRDDLVGIIIAALDRGQDGEIYNAVDNEPVSQFEFYRWLAATLGGEMPAKVEAGNAPLRKRGPSNKSVSNVKLRVALGYQFKYSTFREGYAAEIERARAAKSPPET